MADLRRFDIDDLVNRPGTYVNPQTEVVIVVDDSATLDAELFADAGQEGEWVLVSDDAPLDESRRDELLERLQRRAQRSQSTATPLEGDEDDHVADDEDDLQAAGFDDPSAYEEDDDY
jgi:hypothetical protein